MRVCRSTMRLVRRARAPEMNSALRAPNHSETRSMTTSRLFTVTVICALLAGSAADTPAQDSAISQQPVNSTAQRQSPPAHDAQLMQRYPRYIIQRQDVLLISFPLSPELNQTVTVQPDGYVNLQNGGSVHVQGQTVPEAMNAVKEAYAGVLRQPIVNIDLEDFQKPSFTVSGQVGKPGQYELRSDITVTEALAIAGGLEGSGKNQVFLFHKTPNNMFQVERVNLKGVFNGKEVKEDPAIRPGDMVYVPEKFITSFRKYVPYSMNAGSYLAENP